MKIEPFNKYFAATRDGVVQVEARKPETARGVVLSWKCLDRDHDMLKQDGSARFISVPPKHLFVNEDDARRTVFRLKLTTEE